MTSVATSLDNRRGDRTRLSEAARYSLFILPPLVFIVAIFLYPMAETIWRSIAGGDYPGALYVNLMRDDVFLLSLRNTFVFALLSTACAVLLGYPVAIVIGFSKPRVASMLLLLVMVPFWTSILVRSYAWLVLLGREGLINTVWIASGLGDRPMSLIFNRIGVSIGMVHVMLPYMILPIISTISRINKDVLSAASSLGASRTQSFLRVLLPLTAPGIAGGAALVFVISLGFFITPALMGGPRDLVAAMVIHDRITRQLAWDEAAAISVVLLVLTGGTFFVCARILGLQRQMSLSR